MEQLPILSDSLPIPRKSGIQIQLLSVLSLSHLFDQCGLTLTSKKVNYLTTVL